jgi:hypothetical protein
VNQIDFISQTMSSREIADLVESRHDNVKVTIDRLVDRGVIVRPAMQDVQVTDAMNRVRTVSEYRVGKRDSYVIVAQLSPEFTARLVDRWQALESSVAVSGVAASKLAGELAIAECFTRLLKPSPSSQVAMLAHIAKNHGLEPTFLPSYVVDAPPDAVGGGSLVTKPITALLAEHGIDIPVRRYNRLLANAGLQVERTRKSTSARSVNGTKRFWAVTEAGLQYGKNITNPNSPRETQPHWYEAHFLNLHALVTATLVEAEA